MAGSFDFKIIRGFQSCGFFRNRPHARQHFLSVKIYYSSLIALARMDMNPGGAAFKKICEYLHVSLRIGSHRPTFCHFFEWNLSFSAC